MEALFTTFISPGMAPCLPMQGATLIENCLVDLTNWSNESEVSEYILSQHGGFSKQRKDNDYDHEMGSICIETLFVMEFQQYESRCLLPSLGCQTEPSDNAFNKYLRHQIQHTAVNRRMQTSLQPTYNCCMSFCSFDCSQSKNLHCSCKFVPYDMEPNKEINTLETCFCDKKEAGSRRCEVHDLLIQDMEFRKNGCAWNVYFSAFFTIDDTHDDDPYFINPYYDDQDLLDDSLEIEFCSTDVDEMESSLDSSDFSNLHFACDSLEVGGNDFFDIYDDDEDCDLYGDCCEIINSELLLHDVILSQRSLPGTVQYKSFSGFGKSTSKYPSHYASFTSSSQVTDTKWKGGARTKNDKAKKSVHFPEPDKLVTVYPLVAWAHAYKESRKSVWSKFAQDRAHFRRRIKKLNEIIDPVLRCKLDQYNKNM